MRIMFAMLALLYSTVAFAQGAPPTVGDKPLVQVKPKSQPQPKGTAGKPQSIAARLQACLDIEDGTKGRLDCYDAVIPPKPQPKPAKANGVMDCRFIKEEDARLECFNGFAESIPKLPRS
jgi:hypothetical protein